MTRDLVLISGSLTTREFWNCQKEFFLGQYRVHYLDLFGFQSIEKMAKAFVEKAPEQFHLIGFSMGGYVALELFKHIPEKIKKLVLINSGAKLMSEKGILERERSLNLINQGKFDLLIKLLFKNSIFNHQNKELLFFLQNMAYKVGADQYKDQLIAMLNKPDHTSLLSEINCPTLLIASKDDKIMPPFWSSEAAQAIKNSELILFDYCGHMLPLEQAKRLNLRLSTWL